VYADVITVKGGGHVVTVGMHAGGRCLFVWVWLVAALGLPSPIFLPCSNKIRQLEAAPLLPPYMPYRRRFRPTPASSLHPILLPSPSSPRQLTTSPHGPLVTDICWHLPLSRVRPPSSYTTHHLLKAQYTSRPPFPSHHTATPPHRPTPLPAHLLATHQYPHTTTPENVTTNNQNTSPHTGCHVVPECIEGEGER